MYWSYFASLADVQPLSPQGENPRSRPSKAENTI